jgi:hypothetical protein
MTAQGNDGIWYFDLARPYDKPHQFESTKGMHFDGITYLAPYLYLTATASRGLWVFDPVKPNEKPHVIPSTKDLGFRGITACTSV